MGLEKGCIEYEGVAHLFFSAPIYQYNNIHPTSLVLK
jgi:hypothetical protein